MKLRTRTWLITIPLLLLLGCAEDKPAAFDPEIGITGSLDDIALLKSKDYDFVVPSVEALLMPDESEQVFLENFQRYKDEKEFLYACNLFLPGSLKSTGPDYNPDGVLSYAEKVFRRAQKAGVKVIVFGSSGSRSVPEGFSREEAKQQFIELGKKMGPLAGKYDVVVGIENLNRGESNFINTVAEAYDIVQQIDHDNIQLTADIYHMLREEESPEILHKARDYIYHIDIAEKENRTAPGIAGDNFKPYLQVLKDIGYEGKIAIEARWDNLKKELPVAIDELERQLSELE